MRGVQVEFFIRDGREQKAEPVVSERKSRRGGAAAAAVRPKTASASAANKVNNNANSNASAERERAVYNNDGFLPMEEFLKLQAQSANSANSARGSKPGTANSNRYNNNNNNNNNNNTGNNNNNSSSEKPPSALNANLLREHIALNNNNNNSAQQQQTNSNSNNISSAPNNSKPKAPSRPVPSVRPSGARRERASSPPMWTFSERVDLNTMLLDADEKMRRFRFEHPSRYDKERMEREREQRRPPVFVKDAWLAKHGKTERDSDGDKDKERAKSLTSRRESERDDTQMYTQRGLSPRSAPVTARKKSSSFSSPSVEERDRDYRALFQPVREPHVLPARQRVHPNTSGKIVNHSLPLHPALRELDNHGIHNARWNVMSVAADDPDRLLPSLHQPTKSREDFQAWFYPTTTVRGEAVETIRSVNAVRDASVYLS